MEDLVIPVDLASVLAENDAARAFFEHFPDSSKKNILWWTESARKPTTRAARVSKTVELAAANRMANHPKERDQGPARGG